LLVARNINIDTKMKKVWDENLPDMTEIILFAPAINNYFYMNGVYIKKTNEVIIGVSENDKMYGIKPFQIEYWNTMSRYNYLLEKEQSYAFSDKPIKR
jgi:hypothetical protein